MGYTRFSIGVKNIAIDTKTYDELVMAGLQEVCDCENKELVDFTDKDYGSAATFTVEMIKSLGKVKERINGGN